MTSNTIFIPQCPFEFTCQVQARPKLRPNIFFMQQFINLVRLTFSRYFNEPFIEHMLLKRTLNALPLNGVHEIHPGGIGSYEQGSLYPTYNKARGGLAAVGTITSAIVKLQHLTI